MMPYRLQRVLADARGHLAVLRGMAHLDANDPSSTVLLAGSGRSGTTWLGQIINHGNVYRDIFEPFHPQRVALVRHWPVMRYLPTDASAEHEGSVIKRLLAGHVRSAWTDAYNRKTFVSQRLIKDIRANLLLGWIAHNCPDVKLLLAMRHPCAVAHSRLKLKWDTHLSELLAQPMLMRDHLEAHRPTIERIQREGDAWQRHLTMWCIENLVPLRQLRAGQAHVMQYERYCDNFVGEVDALFGFLGREVPAGIDHARRRQSAHYRRDSAILRGVSLIDDWQSRVSTLQIDQALALLDAFGLDHLYNERTMPRCHRDKVFIETSDARLSSAGLKASQREAA